MFIIGILILIHLGRIIYLNLIPDSESITQQLDCWLRGNLAVKVKMKLDLIGTIKMQI